VGVLPSKAVPNSTGSAVELYRASNGRSTQDWQKNNY